MFSFGAVVFVTALGLSCCMMGGRRAQLGEFKFVVYIEYKNRNIRNFRFPGALLAPSWVLTSCSMMILFPKEEYCIHSGDVHSQVFGEIDKPVHTSTAVSVVCHKDYRGFRDRYQHDLALVLLVKPLPMDDTLATIQPVAEPGWEPQSAEQCVLLGWGVSSPAGDPSSDYLHYLQVDVLRLAACGAEDPVPGSRLCSLAVGDRGDPGALCQGDVGGPLVCDGYLAGVAVRNHYWVNTGSDNCNFYHPNQTVVQYQFTGYYGELLPGGAVHQDFNILTAFTTSGAARLAFW